MSKEKKLPFMSIDETGRRAAKWSEEWAKWILDALRSFVVVAFLFYIAEKSGKWYMWGLAWVGFFALYMFLTAYIGQSQFNFWKTSGFFDTALKLFLMLAAFGIVGVFSLGSWRALEAIVKEISAIQGVR